MDQTLIYLAERARDDGYETQNELIDFIKKSFSNIEFFQSNHEGIIIDKIHNVLI